MHESRVSQTPNEHRRRLRAASLALAVAAASFVAACGGNDSPVGPSGTPSGPSSGSAGSGSDSGSATSGSRSASGGSGFGSGSSGSGGSGADGGIGGSGEDGGNGSGPDGGSSSSGGDGGSSGSGGDGGSACGFDPVTPNATPQTRRVLCYLHSIYGSHILSGQEEDNNDNGMNTVVQATGKYPAIRSFDVNNSQAPTQCVAQWQAGGLCMFGYHMGINGGSYNTRTNIGNVLTAGTAENKSFDQDLDRIAQYVQPLQNAGGVAILRLFHEAGGSCGWFWWSMGTSAQWQDLFKYAFDYLTATKGLKNVLWLAPLCGSPTAAYNPGPGYIDLGGADTYVTAGDYQPLTALFQKTESAFPNRMVALHECGSIPDPNLLQSTGTKWLFFNVWASPFFNAPNNPASHLQAVYSNPYVITRDKLPSFK